MVCFQTRYTEWLCKAKRNMYLWIFIFLIFPISHGIHVRETEYECGAHGRFEYCIDGVPGCVIGCHCHPGYYFDTDTKICEPNIKLTQTYRRNYEVIEPTRVFVPTTAPVAEEPTTTIISNPVDEKIDVITKDADELGDWIYNQFFKTIENQIINETKDDPIISRRSGTAPTTLVKNPTRRSHKYWRARRKKKRRKKKKGLKSKLLRITEDDSLFDSSSSSRSDDGSDSSDSSATEESNESSREKPSIINKKSDHGHRKIVVFNKRPKPPLPSFIFLPNMETPFFPPIGLPPPPIPMYPIVPVPPMMGPFPFPAPLPAPNNETTTNVPQQTTNAPNNIIPEPPGQNNKTEGSGNTPNPVDGGQNNNTEGSGNNPNSVDGVKNNNTEESENNPNSADGGQNNETEESSNNPNSADGGENNKDEELGTDTKNTTDNTGLLRIRTKKRRRPKNKLMQKLRKKIKNKNNYLKNEFKDDLPIELPGFIPNHVPKEHHKPSHEHRLEDGLAALQDVDFQYLSQLIHRADLNKTINQPPPIPAKITNSGPPTSRRHFQSYPYQITQVLDDLTNQPINHIHENQHAYDPSNQFAYNVLTQPNSIPNQPNYNSSIQLNYNMPNQYKYNALNKLNNNAQNIPNYYAFNQPSNNAHNRPHYNALYYPNNKQGATAFNVGQTSSNIPSQHPFNMDNQPTYVSLNIPSHKIPYRKKIEDTNDVYYSNLGRQIAAMIRNLEGDKDVDIEIKSSQGISNSPLFATHGGSRSYWERSVRSPSDIMNSYKNQINSLKLSNEDLFSLESKVEIAASTEPTMSLHELENIISKMHKTQPRISHVKRISRKSTKSSQNSFNVNLLPGNIPQINSNATINKVALKNPTKQSSPNNIFKDKRRNVHSIQPALIGSSLLTDLMFTSKASNEILNNTKPRIPIISTYQNNNSSTYSTSIPDPITVPPIMYKIQNPHRKPNYLTAPQIVKMQEPPFKSYAYTAIPFPLKSPYLSNRHHSYVQTTTSRTYYQQLRPVMLNHKAFKYYNEPNNNQYVYEKSSVPLVPQSVPLLPQSVPLLPQSVALLPQPVPLDSIAPFSRYETYRKRILPSSYFHQEVHHFDYFDDIL